jgi:hypothetical protein
MARRIRGLGQVAVAAPVAGAAGKTAFKWLIGSVLGGAGAHVIGTMLGGPDTQDTWLDRPTFNARMTAMHTGFLMVQCEVGGAQPGDSYGCDEDDQNCICVGGTTPRCHLPDGKLSEWRALRRSFEAFYSDVGGQAWDPWDEWLVSDPTLGQVQEARGFARSLVAFFIGLPSVCPNYVLPFDLGSIVAAEQGSTAEQVAEQVALEIAQDLQANDPPWVKGLRYAAWGFGAVAVLWVGVTVRNAFKKG